MNIAKFLRTPNLKNICKRPYLKGELNQKQKVSQEFRYLLDMENTIETCLEDLLANNYLLKVIVFFKPCGNKPSVLYGIC